MSDVEDFYAHLDRLAVPIFTARPDTTGLAREYRFPTGWNTYTAIENQRVLDRREAFDAVIAAMPPHLAGVDVDTRHGADVEQVRAELIAAKVPILAEVETPSGGRHFYVPSDGTVGSASGGSGRWTLTGVDLRARLADDTGAGMLFLPGTRRPKYDGAGYRIVVDHLDQLDPAGDPDGGAAFASWVASHTAARPMATLRPPATQPISGERLARYFARAFNDVATATEGNRNRELFRVACHVIERDAEHLLGELESISRTTGLGDLEITRTIASARSQVGAKRTPLPDQPTTGEVEAGADNISRLAAAAVGAEKGTDGADHIQNGQTVAQPAPVEGASKLPFDGAGSRDAEIADDEFFTTTPELATVRRWARARYAAPWAVLGAVLLRVAATVEPTVQLPGVIGGRASLNLMVAFVSASGGGKGISDATARMVWPSDIIERPIGSGEGLAATFAPPKKPDDGDERVSRAIVNVPEIDTLAGLASRQGSILLAQLKSVAMGEQIGQANASAATSRIVPAHSYRLCLSVGAQPGHTGVIFDDVTGGTPQRFLWFKTTDPTMPADVVPDPAPLDSFLTGLDPDDGSSVKVIGYGPPEIREAIVAAHLARQRGESDALDGHAMLTRCKVAAVLAIMHRRDTVTELDWRLAGAVMQRSSRTREWIIGETKKADRTKVRERALARAAGEEFISDRKLDRATKAVLRWLERDGELPANKIRTKLKAELRDYCGAALAELVAGGIVLEIPVDRGARYRLSESTGCTPVQGPSSQVREGVPRVQGVPVVHPEVVCADRVSTSHNCRSDAVDEVVHADRLRDGSEVAQVNAGPHSALCRSCNTELPKAATADVCEECADPAHQVSARPAERPLTVVHDGRAVRGTPPPMCPHCGEPLVFDDDQADGYHSSKSKCMRAHRRGGGAA